MAVWQDKFIDVNKYARSGKKLKGVKKIVMHWTANKGGTANNHFRYFNNLKGTYASAHFFVDKEEAICIIPLDEMAYHANDNQKYNADGSAWRGVEELLPNANELSIGIEMCVEEDGSLHPEMLKKATLVALELCKRFKLDPLKDIVRHHDVTHKNCPAHWVKDPMQFDKFKKDVDKLLHPPKPKPPVAKPKVVLPKGVFKRGHKGNEVKQIQEALNKLGFKCGVADGKFGAKTEEALKKFQIKYKLIADGVYGAKTKVKIEELLNK